MTLESIFACIQNNVFFGVVEELKMVIVYCLWLEESLLEAVTLDQLCDTKIHKQFVFMPRVAGLHPL